MALRLLKPERHQTLLAAEHRRYLSALTGEDDAD